MKNSIYKVISVLVSAVLLSLLFVSCRGNENQTKDEELSLGAFRYNNEYQYGKIKWGLSVDEVVKLLPYELEKDTTKEPYPEDYTFYKGQNYVLDGQSCISSYEFQNDGLQIVKFEFHLADQYEEWFEKQVQELVKLYGTENDKVERSNESMHLETTAYKWETNNTMLQIIMVTGDTVNPSVSIALVSK